MSNHTYTLGTRVTLDKYSRFRTLYAVLRDNVLFCFLGMRTGWGKNWEFYPLQIGGTSKEQLDGFQPNGNYSTSISTKGRDEAFARLCEGTVYGLLPERFKDAKELQVAADAAKVAKRDRLIYTLENLRKIAAQHLRTRETLATMLRHVSLTEDQRDAIDASVIHFDGEVKSYGRSISQVEQELAGL